MLSLTLPLKRSLGSLALLVAAGCHGHGHVEVVTPPVRFAEVSLDVSVTDVFGFAYEGVEVRLLKAWQEGTGLIYQASGPSAVAFTDAFGEVFFDPVDMAVSGLGFLEVPAGRAVLSNQIWQDEAVVLVLIGSKVLGWVEAEIPFSYGLPAREVIVEF